LSEDDPRDTDADEAVGHIEGGPVVAVIVPVDEIDDESVLESIPSVPESPRENHAPEKVDFFGSPIEIRGDPIRKSQDEEDNESKDVVVSLKEPESDAGVFHVGPVPESLNHRD
jgi:hypothetical protein